MSLTNINADLLDLEKRLNALSQTYPVLAAEAATAKINYELAEANALDAIAHEVTVQQAEDPKYKPTDPLKAAWATQRCADELREYLNTKAAEAGAKAQLEVLQAILTSVQTRTKIETLDSQMIRAQV